MGPGQRYGVRVDGPWRPDKGLRYNAAKLLLDPYARAIEGDGRLGARGLRPRRRRRAGTATPGCAPTSTAAAHVPRCVVVDDGFDWGDDRPRTALADTVIYEAHVAQPDRSCTPSVPEELRGTYAGLAHPRVVAHLHRARASRRSSCCRCTRSPTSREVVRRGLTNHWGYNTLGFFAPHAALRRRHRPAGRRSTSSRAWSSCCTARASR